RTGALLRDSDHVADDLQIGRGDLPTAIDEIELQLLALGQALEPGAFDLADVDKHVLSAPIAPDETETLLDLEELDLALTGTHDVRWHAASAAAARGTRGPAIAGKAAATAVTTAEAIATGRAPVIPAQTGSASLDERIEPLFPETVPLV